MTDPMIAKLRESIENAIAGADVVVTPGSAGHYSLVVTSTSFAGKGLLESQRLVYSAIAHLMAGHDAPVHAIDNLKTKTP